MEVQINIGFLYLLYLFFPFFFYLRILTRIRMLHPKINSVVIILFTKCLYPLITLKQNLGFHIWIFWLCTIVAGALWCRLQDYWCGNIGCFFSAILKPSRNPQWKQILSKYWSCAGKDSSEVCKDDYIGKKNQETEDKAKNQVTE